MRKLVLGGIAFVVSWFAASAGLVLLAMLGVTPAWWAAEALAGPNAGTDEAFHVFGLATAILILVVALVVVVPAYRFLARRWGEAAAVADPSRTSGSRPSTEHAS